MNAEEARAAEGLPPLEPGTPVRLQPPRDVFGKLVQLLAIAAVLLLGIVVLALLAGAAIRAWEWAL